jgi:hypothetical protein
MKKPSAKTHKLLDEVNALADQINTVLNQKEKARYFESIALLHSFIEDMLKWLVFTQIVWNKSEKGVMPDEELEKLRQYCNKLSLYQLLNLGLSVDLLSYSLFRRLDAVRVERNQLVHQYWLYVHKGKAQILRKKLEKLAGVASALVRKLNDLVEQTGMDESYGFLDIKEGKNLIP